MKFPIVPTARAAWLMALAAPVAVVIAAAAPGAWVMAPALGVGLLVLVVLDALVAGKLADWRINIPPDAEVGRTLNVSVMAEITARTGRRLPRATFQCDPRLTPDGRVEMPLLSEGSEDIWSANVPLVPDRRGTAGIDRLWFHWTGPLGLGARQVDYELEGRTIRIWPDLSPVRSPELQTFLRDAQFGLIARRIRGEGTQFEALSEFEPGMDRRRIDWKASARHTRLYARENESERNNQIVFAFDCGQAMCEPVDGLPRIDRAVTAALTASYVALKGGDRVALFGFAQKPELATPFISDASAFHRLQRAAASLDYHAEEPNFTLALATLTSRLQRRSLVILFSDFTDPTAAEMMLESVGRLLERHVVIFVTIEDSELHELVQADPDSLDNMARAVTAESLEHQRAIVLQRLRQMGVDVIEAPWSRIGYRLIDQYLRIKRAGTIG
ncbi:MAG: DUF58 domain-containing protein [Sphingomonadaceae bacterium]